MAKDKGKEGSPSLARRGVRILCGDPDIQRLTKAQMNALHLCKHQMLAAMRELYVVIPAAKADEIIKKYLARMIEDDQTWEPEKK